MVGCRLNQSEIEKMAAQARLNGHQVVSRSSEADVVVINTCAVTMAASADSRKKIRQAARAGNARIIAAGCYATVAPQDVSDMPEVDRCVPNLEKDELVVSILGHGISPQPIQASAPREALPGRQHRTRAFIKVQDGCENFCTFCITRIARGKSKSQTQAEIFSDIESALAGGVKEIVLTGVNLGSWGHDLKGTPSFPSLIKDIIAGFTAERLRLSSLEPWDIDEEFLEVLRLPGFCRHLHLPLQSGSERTLERMGRRIRPDDFHALLERVRSIVPEIAITTDVMVGFPGESDQDFADSLRFVEAMNFAGGHVFNFSIRPGTGAEKLQRRVPASQRKSRSLEMRCILTASRQKYMQAFLGKQETVLWERAKRAGEEWIMDGLTDTYLRVQARSQENLRNGISTVELREINQTRIDGEISI